MLGTSWECHKVREFALRPMGDFFTGVGPYMVFTIIALSAGFLLTKINIGKTGNQNPPQGEGFVVTCISNIDFLKLGTSE